MRKKPSIKSLKKRLDTVFSQYIRKRDEGKPCITCGKRGVLQAGHFIKRQHLATRWHPLNVNGQCVRCNLYLGGNEGAYALALIKLYGQSEVEHMLRIKHDSVKYTRSDLESWISNYQELLDALD